MRTRPRPHCCARVCAVARSCRRPRADARNRPTPTLLPLSKLSKHGIVRRSGHRPSARTWSRLVWCAWMVRCRGGDRERAGSSGSVPHVVPVTFRGVDVPGTVNAEHSSGVVAMAHRAHQRTLRPTQPQPPARRPVLHGPDKWHQLGAPIRAPQLRRSSTRLRAPLSAAARGQFSAHAWSPKSATTRHEEDDRAASLPLRSPRTAPIWSCARHRAWRRAHARSLKKGEATPVRFTSLRPRPIHCARPRTAAMAVRACRVPPAAAPHLRRGSG